MDVSLYASVLDQFCDNLEDEEVRILDVAYGPGNVSNYVLNKKPKTRLLGVDLAPEMIELAKANNPSAEFLVMDGKEIKKLKIAYHGIISSFYLPYLSKEEAIDFIQTVSRLLEEKGILYLSFMEDDYGKSRLIGPSTGEDDFLMTYYHQEDYMYSTLIECGFEVLKKERINYPDRPDESWNDLVILARKEKEI